MGSVLTDPVFWLNVSVAALAVLSIALRRRLVALQEQVQLIDEADADTAEAVAGLTQAYDVLSRRVGDLEVFGGQADG